MENFVIILYVFYKYNFIAREVKKEDDLHIYIPLIVSACVASEK